MWSILFRTARIDKDQLLAELWDNGTAGVIEEEEALRAFFADSVPRSQIIALAGADKFEIRKEPLQIRSVGVDDWDPLLVGDRFYIAPPGHKDVTPDGRLRLEIDAATAFGSGRHETTQLCLEALERHIAPNAVAADIGCGSGILSAAATKLGARAVFSCDIQQEAIEQTVRQTEAQVFLGSADSIRDKAADLVLANISARVLDRLAFDLRRITKPDGRLIVSGFVRERVPQQYQPEMESERDGWLCWVCRRQDVAICESETDEGMTHSADWWL